MKFNYIFAVAILLVIGLFFIKQNFKEESALHSKPFSHSTNRIAKPQNKSLIEVKTLVEKKEETSELVEKVSSVIIKSCEGQTYLEREEVQAKIKALSEDKLVEAELSRRNDLGSQLYRSLFMSQESTNGLENEKKVGRNRLSKLTQLKQANPDNQLINYIWLSHCVSAKKVDECGSDALSSAINQDSSNAAIWYQVAELRARQNDIQGTLTAMQQAIAAPIYNEYRRENLELYEESFAQIDKLDFHLQTFAILGLLNATTKTVFMSLSKACDTQSPLDAELAHYCIETFKRKMSDTSNILDKKIAVSMYKKLLSSLQQSESLELLEANNFPDPMAIAYHPAMRLMEFDEDLFRYWFEKYKQEGELAAFEYIKEEAIRLSKDPGYDPCSD